MDYRKFRELLAGKEKATVDFKLRCDAFDTGAPGRVSELAKAELAKDLCAMANNGNHASYIIIGVSDDGRRFESVGNTNLNDDNVQSFCKLAIHPPPRVSVSRECWDDALPAHMGKTFVVVQIGPQPRQAHRLTRDFIHYADKLVYRRNDVWVRRGATSDLASPEEVARLVAGKDYQSDAAAARNVRYDKLPEREQRMAILGDLTTCIEEHGGVVEQGRVVLPVGRVRYVWRCAVEVECTTRFSAWHAIQRNWRYEHGVLLLVPGSVAKRAFPSDLDLHYPETWGTVTYLDARQVWPVSSDARFDNARAELPTGWLPTNTKAPTIMAFTLPRLRDTQSLRRSVAAMIQTVEEDPTLLKTMRIARDRMNADLRRWLKQGWLVATGPHYLGGRGPRLADLGDDEVFDRRLSSQVLRRVRVPELTRAAEDVLGLSAGRLPERAS